VEQIGSIGYLNPELLVAKRTPCHYSSGQACFRIKKIVPAPKDTATETNHSQTKEKLRKLRA